MQNLYSSFGDTEPAGGRKETWRAQGFIITKENNATQQ